MEFLLYYCITGVFFAIIAGIAFGRVVTSSDRLTAGTVLGLIVVVLFLWPLVVPMCIFFLARDVHGYNPVRKMWWAPDYLGYWLVDRQGNKHAFGSAIHHKFSEAKVHRYKSDELTVHPNGRILCADGIAYFGDVFGQKLLAPVVGVLAASGENPDGYYIFTEAGEVFAFGSAHHWGSLAEVDPTQYNISWKGYKQALPKPVEPEAALPVEGASMMPA